MNRKNDAMGRAISDYYKHGSSDRLKVFSPMFEEDEMPLEVLFRGFDVMPEIEQIAINMSKGKTLDVGAGSGCHTLVLQERGINVTAIDISPLCVETMKERGVMEAQEQDFFTVSEKYDTILMLLNGIGIVGRLERLPDFFHLLDNILAPDGQLLCDSTDIRYVFENEYGKLCYPGVGYYGELSYHMQYKDTVGNVFPWLYIDPTTLAHAANQNGYAAEIVVKGNHYDYLARIIKKE